MIFFFYLSLFTTLLCPCYRTQIIWNDFTIYLLLIFCCFWSLTAPVSVHYHCMEKRLSIVFNKINNRSKRWQNWHFVRWTLKQRDMVKATQSINTLDSERHRFVRLIWESVGCCKVWLHKIYVCHWFAPLTLTVPHCVPAKTRQCAGGVCVCVNCVTEENGALEQCISPQESPQRQTEIPLDRKHMLNCPMAFIYLHALRCNPCTC